MGKREPRRAGERIGGNRVILQESAATLTEIVQVRQLGQEARFRNDGTVPVCLITPGWGSSGYYSPEVLEAAAKAGVFAAGTHMYLDHPTQTEVVDRPGERTVRDLAAILVTPGVWQEHGADGPGIYSEMQALAHHRDVLVELAPHVGVSIRAGGTAHFGEAQGRKGQIIDSIDEARSVDIVVAAGRGGRILSILESARPHDLGEGLGDWTYEDLRGALRDAVRNRFLDGDDQWAWVRDLTDDIVIFDLEGAGLDDGTYTLAYSTVDKAVTLDSADPQRVNVRTTYEPITDAVTEAQQRLDEAANVADWFAAQIHRDFTVTADNRFGAGYLTRDERIGLSSAIGAALDAFNTKLEDTFPDLYQRDPWAEPDASTTVTETEEVPEMFNTLEEANAHNEKLQAELDEAKALGEWAAAEREAERANNARAADALLMREAQDHVTAAIKAVELPDVAKARIVAEAAKNPERAADGTLDKTKLLEATKAAMEAEVKYLAGAGVNVAVVDLGESAATAPFGAPSTTTTVAQESTEKTQSAFGRLGLSESAAKVAAAGRR
jgi:hypothetical protein